MFFILGLFVLITLLFLFLTIFNTDWSIGAALFGVVSFFVAVGICISYSEEARFLEEVESERATINSIMGDAPSDRERAELAGTILRVNREITELKLDQKSWFWRLETPDSVMDIKPLELICTCPEKK